MSIADRLESLERAIQRIIKAAMQRAPGELSAYILDEMIFTKPERRKDGSRRLPKNRGTQLRTLYGNLTRALLPKGKGNISKVEADSKTIINLEFGFNPLTSVKQGKRVGDLRYGMLHEEGGTIKHPGGTPYRIVKGKAVFVTKVKAAQYFAKTGRELPVTRPHSITIPARPFLAPGKAAYMEKGLPELIDDIIAEVIEELQGGGR
jgi:hypothetical protein